MGAILMHSCGNRQDQLWLLAGTGEGPRLAAALIKRGWRVQVSVVTPSAAQAYAPLGLESLAVGALQGEAAIAAFVGERGPFRWVVDATHPFATQISADLEQVCGGLGQPLLRLERPLETGGSATVLQGIDDLSGAALHGRRLMLAIGGRHLAAAARLARVSGAEVFARTLPSAAGLRGALAADLPQGHLAVLRPLQGEPAGGIEQALCRHWAITDVLCRQSGGVTERLWRRIALEQGLQLWLLRRPPTAAQVETVPSESALLERIAHG